MATLTKADLSEHLFNVLGLNKREAKELVEDFFEQIKGSLEQGDVVKISGFGNFNLRDKNERRERNPKTGEYIPITARRVVTFRAGHKLKSRVERHVHQRAVMKTKEYRSTQDQLPDIPSKRYLTIGEVSDVYATSTRVALQGKSSPH